MSNYLPRTQKKREIQQKQENKLRRMVEKGASLAKLVDAAEVVRAAGIRTINAERQLCCILGSTVRFDEAIRLLRELPVESILHEFGVVVDK
jgi:hypothetical protein